MPRKKTVAARVNHPHSSIPRHPPERDTFVDQFLSTVCDTSRRFILELLAGPNDKDPSVLYERRSGEIAEALGLSSPTISEHLHQLADLHLVTAPKTGNCPPPRISGTLPVPGFF